MGGMYEIYEKFPDGKLMFLEKAEGLEKAKMRFFILATDSQREYLVWDPSRGCEVALRARATA
jgi:hypothetical protein